jgi:hypothetical protein
VQVLLLSENVKKGRKKVGSKQEGRFPFFFCCFFFFFLRIGFADIKYYYVGSGVR